MKLPALRLSLFLLIFISNRPANAQWTWQNPLPTGNTYYDCYFFSPDTGWITGEWGCILHTTDGGETWDLQNSGVTADLYGLYFLNEKYGWAVGDKSTILHTVDGGKEWIIQQHGSNLGYYITSVYFADSLHGWADGDYGGGQYYETVDGGITWLNKYIPGVADTWKLPSMFFIDSIFFWGKTDYDRISHTEDGGNTWILDTLPPVCWKVCFVSRDTGWVISDGHLYRTIDRSISWQEQEIPDQENSVHSLYFTDPLNGWAGGDEFLMKTSDCGVTWQNHATEFYSRDIYMYDTLIGWIFGDRPGGELYQTFDGGETCIDAYYGVAGDMTDISFGSPDFGITVYYRQARYYLLITNNGGSNWEKLSLMGDSTDWSDVWVEDDQNAWVCSNKGAIVHTGDGGNVWSVQRDYNPDEQWSEIQFLDAHNGFVAGETSDGSWDPIILAKTNDGGKNWTLLPCPFYTILKGMWFTDTLTGYLLGITPYEGTSRLFWTFSGGENWELLDLPPEGGSSIIFTDDEKGFISSSNCILKTIDGGQSWEKISLQDIYGESIWFSDNSNGWCVGFYQSHGVAYRTADGGNTWTNIPLISGEKLHDVSSTDPENVWVSGEIGTILNWGEPNPVFIGDDNLLHLAPVPLIFPNPSRDILNIDLSFCIKDEEITFSIFSLQGQLLNEETFRKKYKYDKLILDLEGFSSGTYIIHIVSESIDRTEKFIILN